MSDLNASFEAAVNDNDILLVEGRHYSPDAFLAQIKRDFDQLYAEAGQRRRMSRASAFPGRCTGSSCSTGRTR